MLKRIITICGFLLLINTVSAQLKNVNVSPLEYKVSKQYFQEHYVKDEEDKKIARLFDRKRGSMVGFLVAAGASSFLSNYTPPIVLNNHVTVSPLIPVTILLAGVSIFKGVRYSRKKKFLYVTGQVPLPNYINNQLKIMN